MVVGSPRDARAHIKHLHVKDGHIRGTNGDRMHMVKLPEDSEFENGFYEVIKNNKAELILNYADSDTQEREYPCIESLLAIEGNILPGEFDNVDAYVRIIRTMPEDICINYDYVKDIFCQGDAFDITVNPKQHCAVVFRNEIKIAAIMPIKMHKL